MAPINTTTRAFLLLPGLSLPLHKQSLRAAYKPTFESLLPSLSKHINGRDVLRLDVGIVLPQPYSTAHLTCRTQTYSEFQTLIGQVYTLICIVAAQHQIDLDIPGGLDIRVVLLEHPSTPPSFQILQSLSGPLINLQTLIPSLPTSTVFYTPESESGISLSTTLIQHYQTQHSSTPTIHRLPCGPSLTQSSPPSSSQHSLPSHLTSHHSIAVGGTFDHLHIGHKLLLTFTIFLSSPYPSSNPRKITIGITTDSLLANKKHSSALESWETRQQRTAEFVESILAFSSGNDTAALQRREEVLESPGTPNPKVVRVTYTLVTLPNKSTQRTRSSEDAHAESTITINYTQITDPYGPTITDEDITALVISAETRAGGKAVNDKRREKGWNELEVFEVDVLDARPAEEDEQSEQGRKEAKEGFESKISSTEIRRRVVEMEEGRERDGKL